MHQYNDNRGNQEGCKDAEHDHEWQDVLVEAGGVGLAYRVLAAGWLAFGALPTRLTRVPQAPRGAVVWWKTVETQSRPGLVCRVEAHLTAVWLTIEWESAGSADLEVGCPSMY
jgi:hypothetical protein